jgi:hypothetical protein
MCAHAHRLLLFVLLLVVVEEGGTSNWQSNPRRMRKNAKKTKDQWEKTMDQPSLPSTAASRLLPRAPPHLVA